MIVIKGNLILTPPPSLSSEGNEISCKNIVAYADLDQYDIAEATILVGDITLSQIDSNQTIIVTGEAVQVGGEHAS